MAIHRPRGLVVWVVATVIAAGCTALPAAPSTPIGGPTPAAGTPATPDPRPTPVADATPATTEVPVSAADLLWEEMPTLSDARIDGLLGFRGGYVAYGATGPESRPVAWLSPDGRDWSIVELAGLAPCGASAPTRGGYVTSGASDGDQVALVGARWPGGGQPCGDTWPAAWVISEGGMRLAEPPSGWQAMTGAADAVWTTPAGWETFVETDLRPAIWQSTDGLYWTGPTVVARGEATFVAAGSDPLGLRLMAVRTRPTGDEFEEQLLESTDGVAWRALDPDPSRDATIGRIVPPQVGSSRPWVLVTSREGEDAATMTSRNRRQWTSSPFPMPAVADLAVTRYGLLATGFVPCLDQGGTCPPQDRTQFLSTDGQHWTELGVSVPAAFSADGPAGVVALGRSTAKGTTKVWRMLDGTATP